MTSEDLPLWEYVKEAFNASPKVPGLGNLPMNWMALLGIGTLGLLNPGFWLLGAGIEVAYLVSMSHNDRFRNYVRGKRLIAQSKATEDTWQDREASLLSGLSDVDRERYHALIDRIDRAKALQGDSQLTGMIAEVAEEGLQKLQWIYLRLLASREKLHRQLDPTARRQLGDELDQTVRRLEALGTEGDARIRKSLESTATILQQRLANLDGAQSNLTYIDSELRRIEHQAELIIEDAALSSDPEGLTSRIDHVTSTFGETHEWMKLHKELLTDLDDEDEDPRPPPTKVHA